MELILGIILAAGALGALIQVLKLNAQQIAGYASQAGFTGQDLVTAVAIALAESGGNAWAVGDNATSFGLWQIHYTVHPEFQPLQLFDPAYNAQAAFAIYRARGGTFQDWSTFNNGAYNAHLSDAQAAVSA